MKKTLLVLGLVILLVAGCPDPIKNYIVASNAVTGAANGGRILVESGAMSHESAKEYAELLDQADTILKVWRVAIDSNSTTDTSALDVILDQLIEMQVAAMKRQKEGQ